jgi:hypothetical protein
VVIWLIAVAPWALEEDEQAGEAVFGLEGAVVQEPACGVPAVLVIE